MSAIIELDRKEHLCKWMVSIQGREISVSLIDSLSPAPPPPPSPQICFRRFSNSQEQLGGGHFATAGGSKEPCNAPSAGHQILPISGLPDIQIKWDAGTTSQNQDNPRQSRTSGKPVWHHVWMKRCLRVEKTYSPVQCAGYGDL